MVTHTKSLHSPPQWGHQKMRATNQETRASAQSGCLRARVRLPTQGESLSSCNQYSQKGAPPCFNENKETILSIWLESHRRGGILTLYERVITETRIVKANESAKLPRAQDRCH